MKRTLVASLAMIAVLVLAAPAVAQPESLDITLSDTQGQCPGDTVTVTGEGTVAGDVVIAFDDQVVGGGATDPGGNFSITVDLPAAALGAHVVTATVTGPPDAETYIPPVATDSAAIGCVGAAGAALPEEEAEGLAVTGGDFKVWMLLLGGLIAIGAVALIAGRRRARRA